MWIDVDQLLGSPWVYLAVVALILCDVYLPVLPSGTTLIVATVYAHTGRTSEIVLLLCAAGASTLGDHLAFRLARAKTTGIARLTARMTVRIPGVSRVDDRLRATLRARTGRGIVFARFVPAGRCVVTFTCGSDPRIGARRFQTWSAVAALAWATYTVGLGYLNALLFSTSWLSAGVAAASLFILGTLAARSKVAAELSLPPPLRIGFRGQLGE